MSLVPCVLRVTYSACLESSLHGTMTVTWRNPASVSSTDPRVSTQQRLRHISALTRVVTSQSLRRGEVWPRDASSQKVLSLLRHTASRKLTFQSDLDNFAKISVHTSVHFTASPSISLQASKKFPNTYAPWRPLPSVWQPGAEWNVSRQRMSTHKSQLWFRQTLRGGEGNIKAKVKSSLGSSAPRFT